MTGRLRELGTEISQSILPTLCHLLLPLVLGITLGPYTLYPTDCNSGVASSERGCDVAQKGGVQTVVGDDEVGP